MKTTLKFTVVTVAALLIIGCGWKPDVTAVPVTPPWSTMNLPIKENAVVWASTATEFKAVHKDDKRAVLGKYTDALKAQGWTLDSFDDKNANTYYADMAKGGEKIAIEVYDFKGTGVIIKKK
jgi:hypothetical protein